MCCQIGNKWDHAIEIEAGAKVSSTKVYPLSLNEQAELDTFIEENLASGRIHPSKSPMAARVIFIKKRMDPSGWFRTTRYSMQRRSRMYTHSC
jgi:hypothetical protein